MSEAIFGRLLIGLMIQNGLFIGVTLWWMRCSGRTVASVGLARPTSKQIWLGIGCGIGVAIAGHGLGELELWLLHEILTPATFQRLQRFTEIYGAEHAFQQLPALWMMAAFALVGSLLAPIGEEMLFRCLILHNLQEKLRLGTGSAIVISSLLFALAHVSPFALLPLFLMGIVFAVLYVRTGSLWVPIGMHVTNNAINFMLLTLTRHL